MQVVFLNAPQDCYKLLTKYPSIVFEIKFDGPDRREQKQLPMTLSSEFISFIKSEIIKARGSAVAEFYKIFF